jgi:hypothetical protein
MGDDFPGTVVAKYNITQGLQEGVAYIPDAVDYSTTNTKINL